MSDECVVIRRSVTLNLGKEVMSAFPFWTFISCFLQISTTEDTIEQLSPMFLGWRPGAEWEEGMVLCAHAQLHLCEHPPLVQVGLHVHICSPIAGGARFRTDHGPVVGCGPEFGTPSIEASTIKYNKDLCFPINLHIILHFYVSEAALVKR